MVVTQRQLAESIINLSQVSKDLRGAADAEPLEETRGRHVPASVQGLRSHADFIDRVVSELLSLIDDEEPVEVSS